MKATLRDRVAARLDYERIARDPDGHPVPARKLAGGALWERGWFRSHREQVPVDREGEPLAWISYAALSFLEPRLSSEMRVFEYGSGLGTLWWARRVKQVVSVEHDRGWYEQTVDRAPGNAEILHADLDGRYAEAIADQPGEFHIAVVDGRRRPDCARNAVNGLTDDGVIVWDDAERPQYAEGQRELKRRDFKRLDFTSMGPISNRDCTTAVFYRRRNCLGI